jgi:hypothetical protein
VRHISVSAGKGGDMLKTVKWIAFLGVLGFLVVVA